MTSARTTAEFSTIVRRGLRGLRYRLPIARVLSIGLISLLVVSFEGAIEPSDAVAKSRHAIKKAHGKKAYGKPTVRHARPGKITTRPALRSASPGSLATVAPLLTRAQVLAYEPQRLARIGRHIIVGYHGYAEVKHLVEMRAIAGVFITDHNAKGRPASILKAELDALQAIRRSQGLPPLIIAADQEGGTVSRLSPPLQRQPSLSAIIAKLSTNDARRTAVEAYASTQAAELQRLGVTLNFAPVVDLKLDPNNRSDGETRLRLRSIAAEPSLVAKVAGWYCATLARSGIMCTLKHFPGLGRVKRDTHVTTGEIAASEDQLALSDWVPFRRLMDKPYVATMLGHVRVNAVDPSTPASYSKVIIADLIRAKWRHTGLLITDDFSMGAITHSPDRAGGAAVKALQAGVDLVLVSFNEKHYDSVMSSLLDADARGLFDQGADAASVDRIVKATTQRPTLMK